jgi:hypothetical protein
LKAKVEPERKSFLFTEQASVKSDGNGGQIGQTFRGNGLDEFLTDSS